MSRRLYIDWLRGLAVALMIMWHSIDAWTLLAGRDTFAFGVVQFLAGWVAPMFLFLAGVAIPFAGASRMARGATRLEAGWMLQRRGWQIFAIAHLFRFQSFLLNPNGTWAALLKPDILNILGLGMVAAAFLWSRAATPRRLALAIGLPILVIAAILTPWSRHWWWPTLLHPRLEAYVRPVGNLGQFTLFPTVAYLLAGALAGVFAQASAPSDVRAHRRMALAGAVVFVAGLAAAPVADWWTSWGDSLSLFLCRTGAMTTMIPAAWLLVGRRSARSGPLVVFGQTSLFVYWVHVELVYGVFSYPLKLSLPRPAPSVATLLFLLESELLGSTPAAP
jgi:uncharacterized membrane protein